MFFKCKLVFIIRDVNKFKVIFFVKINILFLLWLLWYIKCLNNCKGYVKKYLEEKLNVGVLFDKLYVW